MNKQDNTIHTSQDDKSPLSPVGNDTPSENVGTSETTGNTVLPDQGAKVIPPTQGEVFGMMVKEGLPTSKYDSAAAINKEIGARWSKAHRREDKGNCQYLVNETRAKWHMDTDAWRMATKEEEEAYLTKLGRVRRSSPATVALNDEEKGKITAFLASLKSMKGMLPAGELAALEGEAAELNEALYVTTPDGTVTQSTLKGAVRKGLEAALVDVTAKIDGHKGALDAVAGVSEEQIALIEKLVTMIR